MSEACSGRIKDLKVLEFVCVASQTRYARATGAQQSHTRLGLTTEAISHKIGTLVAYTGVPQTCAERVRSGTYSKRIYI